jgi:conjugal transfer ATP-binding protein TraC
MDVIRAAKHLLQRESFSELLPYLAYDEENKIFALDDGIGFVIECTPLRIAGSDTVATLRSLFESSSIPQNTCIQFMLISTTDVKHAMDQYVLLREVKNGNNIFTEYCKKRRDFYVRGSQKSILSGFDYIVRDFRLIVSVKVPISVRTPEEYKKTKEKVAEIKSNIIQSLKTGYLHPRTLSETEFVYLLKLLINPSHEPEATIKCDPSIPLKDQIVYADNNISVEKDYMMIDGKYCKSFTVNQFPEEWDISSSASFIGDMYENLKQIPADFFISFNCIVMDQTAAEKKIKKMSMAINYQAFGAIAKFLPDILRKKESYDKMLAAMANKEQLIKTFFHFFVYADDVEHLHKLTGTIKSVYRNLGITLQDDTYINLPLFMQSLPMGLIFESRNELRRYKTMTTRAAAELAPVQADWKGTGTPALMLFSRRGQYIRFNFFDYKQGGKNAFVIAGTGGGKSFFINEIVFSYLGLGSKIWIIDVGGSYKKICEIFGGDFITFGPSSKVNINPFSKISSYQELIDEHMSVLKGMIAQMASPNNPLTDIELSYLEEAIGQCFMKYSSDTTITNISDYLSNGGDPRQKDLAKMLFPYTKHGSYAQYFDGKSNLKPDNNFVVLELEELKQKKDLQEVVLLSLIHQIQQDMYLSHSEEVRKMVIIDEAWDLLGGGNTAKFMEDGYRRFRKYGGAAITITQSYEDFNRVAAGEAIIANSAFKFFGRQEQASIEALRESKQIALPENVFEQIMSINTDPGNYSEIFCLTPMGFETTRLIVDRFTQLLYTTDPEEKVAIQKYLDKGLSLTRAIESVIESERNY